MRMASIWTQAKKILCPRRPRGFQFMGFGRMMNPVGRTTTPVEKLLALAGLQYLGANTPYMFYPNDPSRSASNRHYLYSSAGWNAGTLSAGSEKNWVNRNTSQFVNTPAGNLTLGCIVEPACTKLCTNIANFVPFGTGKATGEEDGLGGTTAITLTEDGTPSAAHYIQSGITVPKNTRIACTLWVKRITGTRNVNIYLNQGSNYTYVKVNLSTLACTQLGGGDGVAPTDAVAEVMGSFVRISFTGIISAGTANGDYTIYMSDSSLGVVYNGDGVSSLRLCYTMTEASSWATSWVAGVAGTVRAADALRFTGLSGLASAGGMLAMLRLPYASTVPAANQYHVGLNGADSTDNGAFLYTKAADDHLYAELRSGGAQQAEIDLGAYVAGTQYAVALDWDASGLRAAINGVEKTASGAVTVPASIDRLEVGRGISTDTAHGGETPGILLFNSARTVAERAALTGATLKAAMFAGI